MLCWVLELRSTCGEGRVLSDEAQYGSLCCFPVMISMMMNPCLGTSSVLVVVVGGVSSSLYTVRIVYTIQFVGCCW